MELNLVGLVRHEDEEVCAIMNLKRRFRIEKKKYRREG